MSDYAAGILVPPLLDHIAEVAPRVTIKTRGIVEDVERVLHRAGEADFVIYPT